MALKENNNIYSECKHIKRVKPDAQVTEGNLISSIINKFLMFTHYAFGFTLRLTLGIEPTTTACTTVSSRCSIGLPKVVPTGWWEFSGDIKFGTLTFRVLRHRISTARSI